MRNISQTLIEHLQACNLRDYWPVAPVANKQSVLNRFGVSADTAMSMGNALEHLLDEVGPGILTDALIHPELTDAELMGEEV